MIGIFSWLVFYKKRDRVSNNEEMFLRKRGRPAGILCGKIPDGIFIRVGPLATGGVIFQNKKHFF